MPRKRFTTEQIISTPCLFVIFYNDSPKARCEPSTSRNPLSVSLVSVDLVGGGPAYVIDVLRDTSKNLKNNKTREKNSARGHAVLSARHCRDSTHYPPRSITCSRV